MKNLGEKVLRFLKMVRFNQKFVDYKSKYLDLRDKVKADHEVEQISILKDIDFELELIHRDRVNVAYIIRLLEKLSGADDTVEFELQKKAIMVMLSGDVELRCKRELIE